MEVLVYKISGSREDCQSVAANLSNGQALQAEPRRQFVLLDTSSIIDGRVSEVILAGFLDNAVAPSFVLAELQQLADGSDPGKRSRGRAGLELLQELSDSGKVGIVEYSSPVGDWPKREVDDLLVEMALAGGHKLLTCDVPLARVASLKGVEILNLGKLAEALAPKMKVGDRVDLKIIKPGQDFDQGVGYLEDGTMIVVDGAGRNIGQKITVRISNVHRASGGRMLFATTVAPMEVVKVEAAQ